MSLKSVELRCQHCNQWFSSGIKIPGDIQFNVAALAGMLKECPHCGENTHLTTQNVRVRPPHDEPPRSR
jgi:hypothetical protein